MTLQEALELSEISDKTLTSYKTKAAGAVNAFHTRLFAKRDDEDYVTSKERDKNANRVKGALKAGVKLRMRTEGKVNEISKNALVAYVSRASVDIGAHNNKLWRKNPISAADEKKHAKRVDGTITAKKKIAAKVMTGVKLKEAVEITEVLAQASQVQQLRQQNVAKRRVAAYGTLTTARQNTHRKRRVNQAARYRRGIQNRGQPAGMSGRHHGLKAH